MSDDGQLAALLADLQTDGRFAPRPSAWDGLWKLLRKGLGRDQWPPAPLILSAHWSTTAMQKHERLIEQLEWAMRMDRLADALDYIDGLSDNDWKPLEKSEWNKSSGSI